MADAEQLLSSCSIDVVVPDRVIDLPCREELGYGDTWLVLVRDAGARQRAFFGVLRAIIRAQPPI